MYRVNTWRAQDVVAINIGFLLLIRVGIGYNRGRGCSISVTYVGVSVNICIVDIVIATIDYIPTTVYNIGWWIIILPAW